MPAVDSARGDRGPGQTSRAGSLDDKLAGGFELCSSHAKVATNDGVAGRYCRDGSLVHARVPLVNVLILRRNRGAGVSDCSTARVSLLWIWVATWRPCLDAIDPPKPRRAKSARLGTRMRCPSYTKSSGWDSPTDRVPSYKD